MPFFRAVRDEFKDRLTTKNAASGNEFVGFQGNGAVVVRDRRGTVESGIPSIDEKGFAGGGDPLAIYKPSGSKQVDAAKAMSNFTGWVYPSVNAIAREAANTQFRLFEVQGDDQEVDPDHELLTLLDGVNEDMTGPGLKYTTFAHLELAGNFCWLLDGVKSDTDKPRAIYPLNPGRVWVKLNKTNFPYKIDHYEFTIDGKIFRFQPYEILHGKYPDPNDPFVGVSFVQSIPAVIDSSNYMMEYNRTFFVRGANISLYVQSDTNVEGNIDRIKRGMSDTYGGVQTPTRFP